MLSANGTATELTKAAFVVSTTEKLPGFPTYIRGAFLLTAMHELKSAPVVISPVSLFAWVSITPTA
jgi:hypothetical protein